MTVRCLICRGVVGAEDGDAPLTPICYACRVLEEEWGDDDSFHPNSNASRQFFPARQTHFDKIKDFLLPALDDCDDNSLTLEVDEANSPASINCLPIGK